MKAAFKAQKIHETAKKIRSKSRSTKENKKILFTQTPQKRGKSISSLKKIPKEKFDKKKFLEDLEQRRQLQEEVMSVRHFTPLTKNYGGKQIKFKTN